MTKPVKERKSVKNPNYERFYKFKSEDSDHCKNCPAKIGKKNWSNVPKYILGLPVHTNWAADSKTKIKIVYICESPSNREISHALPSIQRTGQNIYKCECSEENKLHEFWLDKLDDSVYRTNIVRCQADAGLQKRVQTTIKNKRVREAFEFCIKHLNDELEKIFEILNKPKQELKVVIAVGKGFKNNAKNVKDNITELNKKYPNVVVEIEEMKHPSAN